MGVGLPWNLLICFSRCKGNDATIAAQSVSAVCRRSVVMAFPFCLFTCPRVAYPRTNSSSVIYRTPCPFHCSCYGPSRGHHSSLCNCCRYHPFRREDGKPLVDRKELSLTDYFIIGRRYHSNTVYTPALYQFRRKAVGLLG